MDDPVDFSGSFLNPLPGGVTADGRHRRKALFILLWIFAILSLGPAAKGPAEGNDPPSDGTVTVDFLESLGLEANALAPQVAVADPARNRIFAACANSSAVAVIEEGPPSAGAVGLAKEGHGRLPAVFTIPVGSRTPRWLRDAGMKVSGKTGKLLILGQGSRNDEGRLIVVDPDGRSARAFPLPGIFEALALDEDRQEAYLVGRTCPSVAAVDLASGRVRSIPCMEAAPPLPFMAASPPPPIRVPFFDAPRNRLHVVDGTSATLYTIDLSRHGTREGPDGKVVEGDGEGGLEGEAELDEEGFAEGEAEAVERRGGITENKLPVESFPRWHVAGFDPETGRIYAALEDDRRTARHALAIDVGGTDHQRVDLPEKHTEPAGVACDAALGELFIPYDNVKRIHAVTFGDAPEVTAIELPDLGVDATAYDPRTRILYAAGWKQAALYVVDAAARKWLHTVPFFPVHPHMNHMAYSPGSGKLYVPTGAAAVNGVFGAALTVFDTRTWEYSEAATGWAPTCLARQPGREAFYVFGAEREYAVVEPDGSLARRRLPHPYPREALSVPGGRGVMVAYGPHTSIRPNFYISAPRNGIYTLDGTARVVKDRLTPRLAQGMLFDREGSLWAAQNTWGKEAPYLLAYPPGGSWVEVRLPPEADNECVLRLVTLDPETGKVYAVRTGDRNTDPGICYEVDPKRFEVTGTWEVGRTPTDLCVLPGADKILVTNFDDDTVTVIRTRENGAVTSPVPGKPFAAAAHAPSGAAYLLLHLGNALVDMDRGAYALPDGALPNNLLVDPRTGEVFITAHGPEEMRVYRFDPETREVRTLHTHAHPYGEVSFDRAEAAFGLRGQWGDGLFRITDMALDDRGRLWITDYLGGKLLVLTPH